jgi:hypothetical protein
VVLLERELADALGAALGVHDEQVGHGVAPADARHALEDPRRAEDDPPVRQVAGVVVVHVGPAAARDLPKLLAVRRQLVDLPPPVLVERAEQHPVGIEVQVHVADELAAFRPVQRRQPARRRDGRQHGDLVVIAVARQRAVALPVLRQPQAGAPQAPLDHQQLAEVQQGVGQQRLALETDRLLGDARQLALVDAAGRRGTEHGLLHGVQPPEELRPARVLGPERVGQVFDGQAEGLEVQHLQPRQRLLNPLGLVVQPADLRQVGLRPGRGGQLPDLLPGAGAARRAHVVPGEGGEVTGRPVPQPDPVRLLPLHLLPGLRVAEVPEGQVPQLLPGDRPRVPPPLARLAGRREVVPTLPAVVPDLDQQLVVALAKLQAGLVLVGADAAEDLPGDDLPAVAPDGQPVVAAEVGHHPHRPRRGDRAVEVDGRVGGARELVDHAVGVAGRLPAQLAVRLVQLDLLLRLEGERERVLARLAERADPVERAQPEPAPRGRPGGLGLLGLLGLPGRQRLARGLHRLLPHSLSLVVGRVGRHRDPANHQQNRRRQDRCLMPHRDRSPQGARRQAVNQYNRDRRELSPRNLTTQSGRCRAFSRDRIALGRAPVGATIRRRCQPVLDPTARRF